MRKVGTLNDYCTLTQAARQTGLAISTLKLYYDSGKLRGIRTPDGRRLLLRRDVETLIAQRQRVDSDAVRQR